MAAATRVQTEITVRACDLAKRGYEVIRDLANLANDVDKLAALEGLETAEFTGRLAELTGEQAKQSVGLMIQAVLQIGGVLEADASAKSKAMALLAIYGV